MMFHSATRTLTKPTFGQKSRFWAVPISQEMGWISVGLWKIESPICGLQLHVRISLGRLETAGRRGHLYEPKMGPVMLQYDCVTLFII